MSRRPRKSYTAKWEIVGGSERANVSFYACDDVAAKRKADRLAKELDCRRTPRTLMECGGRVVEVLNTGMTRPES